MRMVVSLAFVVGACATALATWESPVAKTDGSTSKNIDCGGITGQLKLHQDWSHSSSSDTATSASGSFGANWAGNQYALTIGNSGSADADVSHKYVYRFNGAGGHKIRVLLDAEVVADGSCSQDNTSDTQWWWDPAPTVSDEHPQVKRYDQNGNLVATHGFPSPTDAFEEIDATTMGYEGSTPTGHAGSGTSSSPATPGATVTAGVAANSGGATSGAFDGKTDTIPYLSGHYVQVEYSVSGTAGSNCDNAKVSKWELLLETTLYSESVN